MKLSIKDASDLLAKWLSIGAAIAGGFIWLHTYVESKRNELTGRQQQSISFFKDYNNEATLTLRQDYFDIKQSAHAEVDPKIAQMRSAAAVDAESERLIGNTALRIIAEKKKGLEMRRLVEVFDQAATCVDIGICDKNVAFHFFGGDAYDIRYVLSGFIAQVKQTRPTFGWGIDMLAYEPKPKR